MPVQSALSARTLGAVVASLMLILDGAARAEQPYEVEWVHVFGANRADRGYGVAVNSEGLVYVSGNTGYQETAFLAQYDSAGNEQWLTTLGTPEDANSYGLAIDSSDNPIISGFTLGDLAAPNAGSSDAFIAKYDPSGQPQWVRQTGQISYDVSNAVATDAMGNNYLTWYSNIGYLRGTDCFIEKYNADGDVEWTRSFGSSKNERINAAHVDSQGNLWVAGNTQGVLGSQSTGSSDAFVAKYTSDGDLVSMLQFGSLGADHAEGIVSDYAGNIYVTGDTQGLVEATPLGTWDAFLIKINSAGAIEWKRQLGTSFTDSAHAVTLDPWGNIFITGSTSGAFPGEVQPYTGDLFLAKYNTSGSLLWVDQFSTGDDHEVGFSIDSDSAGNIYISGEAERPGSSGSILLMKYAVPEPSTLACSVSLVALVLKRHTRIGCRCA